MYAVALRAGESRQQPLEDREDLGQREPPYDGTQRASFEVLHRDIGRPLVLEVVVDGDAVWMCQGRGQLGLVEESRRSCLVARVEPRKLLQRHELVQSRVTREVDDGVRTAADLAHDFVATDQRFSTEGSGTPSIVSRRARSCCRDSTPSFR